ncbi:MAG: glycosyltransferase family 2 protein [Saprospiraceae bacterium]
MINRFTTPEWVKRHYFDFRNYDEVPTSKVEIIKRNMSKFQVEDAIVSIVIPAYNEEENLLSTLSSFSELRPRVPTELLVINNNSNDRTQEILDRCGVNSIFQPIQGRTYARQLGLEKAKGKIILSADADSIYPADWGNQFVQTLLNRENVAVVYGRYSFIPSKSINRIGLAMHEFGGELMFARRKGIDLCINAVGFNTGFRKAQALAVGGYDPKKLEFENQRSEDGWLAQSLYKKFGKIVLVPSTNRVWTSDRRLLDEGSLTRASVNRVYRYLNGTNLANT